MARIPFKAGSQKSFTPMPKGTYLLVVDAVEEQTAKSSGNPMLKITHLVEDHPTYAGRKVIRFFSMSEKATFRLRAMLEAAIPDKIEITETDQLDENGDPIFDVDFDTDDLIGARYYADAGIRQNKERGEEEQTWNKERSADESAQTQGEAAEDDDAQVDDEGEGSAGDAEEQAQAAQAQNKGQQAGKGAQQARTQGGGQQGKGGQAQGGKGTQQAQGGKTQAQAGKGAQNNGRPAQQQAAGRERTRMRA